MVNFTCNKNIFWDFIKCCLQYKRRGRSCKRLGYVSRRSRLGPAEIRKRRRKQQFVEASVSCNATPEEKVATTLQTKK